MIEFWDDYENEKRCRMDDFARKCPFEEVRELTDALDLMGYFDAPASTKYHGNFEGGLYEHSRAVYDALVLLTEKLGLKWDREESAWVVAFLHDICKCDMYRRGEEGWSYTQDQLLWGHGEKSVMLLHLLPIKPTMEEIACIRYHMGAFTDREQWKSYTGAVERYENVLWTHTADMMASHIDGV